MNNIKMIVLDLDGTLLRDDKTISDITIAALQKCRAANIIVAIATARFWIAAEKFIDILQPDYEITADGAIIHHGDAALWEDVMALSDSMRIPLKEIAAFGDDENDIAMLRACGTGIAMGNAIDEVKAVADYVCASNEEDGVAKWLEKYLL